MIFYRDSLEFKFLITVLRYSEKPFPERGSQIHLELFHSASQEAKYTWSCSILHPMKPNTPGVVPFCIPGSQIHLGLFHSAPQEAKYTWSCSILHHRKPNTPGVVPFCIPGSQIHLEWFHSAYHCKIVLPTLCLV